MRSALLLSPGLSLEEISLASSFAHDVLDTNLMTSSCIDESVLQYMALARDSLNLGELRKADLLISLFQNGNYRYAPLTIAIKDLASKGVPYHKVGWVQDTTSRFATEKIFPAPGNETDIMGKLKGLLKNSKKAILILGPEVLSLTNCMAILNEVRAIVKETGASLFMPNPYGNLDGILSLVNYYPFEQVDSLVKQGEIDLLYLIGDNPYIERPNVDKIIFQGAFPPSAHLQPDLSLPSALWSECNGSYLDMFGRIKRTRAAAIPHGYALSHQDIFKKISARLKRKAPRTSVKNIKEKITNRGSLNFIDSMPGSPFKCSVNGYPFVLIQEKGQHVFHNIDMGKEIEGLGELISSGHLIINPSDAVKLGIDVGDPLEVRSFETGLTLCAEIRKTVTPGYVFMHSSENKLEFETNPCPVKISKQNV